MNESQNIEWKENWHDAYLEWVCGFANAQGGKIYIGINDKGVVTGIPNSKELLENIPQKTKSTMGLMVDVNLLEKDNKQYIEICVSPSTVAISLRGHYYYRSGSTKTELIGTALNEFLLKKAGKTWDDVTEPRATLEDISPESIAEFKREALKSGRLPADIESLSKQEILEKLKLIDGHNIKRAALILFGKDPNKFFPNVRVKIGRFGETLTDLKFQEVIEGNLFYSMNEVINMLTYKFLVKNITFEGMLRIETLEYPEDALKEILLNALVHGRYVGCTIQIRVYDDRISIWNDGPLPDEIKIEMLKIHHSSKPRNPLIADVCFKAGLIDSWGRGTLKILEAAKKANLLTPKMEELNGGFEVTLWKSSEAVAKSSEAVAKSSEDKLLELLGIKGTITPKEAEACLELSASGTRKILKKLVTSGAIKAFGNTTSRYYKVNK